MAPLPDAIYATLLISDSYLPGAMVLAHSLRDHGAKAKLAILVTLDTISATTIDELKTIYDEIIPVNHITNKAPANLFLMDRPDLISAFTKIELWKQTQFSRIVYIDADAVAIRAPNELLQLQTSFAAATDIGWPDCFNSGVMVLNPNLGDYYSLLALAQRNISFDGADQGLLNMHFRDWERLSFAYNCTPSGNYQYVPAYKHFQSSINIIHFIGSDKPWVLGRYSNKATGVYDELLGRWWSVYDRHYRHKAVSISGQGQPPSMVPNFVKGEANIMPYGYSSQSPMINVQPPDSEHQSVPMTEAPMADQPDVVETIRKGQYEPTPTVEQRQFTAPMMDWDASRAPPPADARPEAANFPTQVYKMSSDKALFQAPEYPEPPKDMWYQVPQKAPQSQRLEPLFPWESRAPKPTRVFPTERSPASAQLAPLAEPEPEAAPVGVPSTTDESAPSESSISTPTAAAPEGDPWQAYTRTNAWDDMPEINRYVQAIQRPRQGKVQVLHGRTPSSDFPTSPARKHSLILTDFPDEVERPSLPVTPAPIRGGSSFWGEERDAEGELPAAEGVPRQEEWVSAKSTLPSIDKLSSLLPFANFTWRCQYCGKQNPVLRLEELQRRQSEVLMDPKHAPAAVPEPPQRQMPESKSKEEAEAADEKAMAPAASMTRGPKPTFAEPNYNNMTGTNSTTKEPELKPTQISV